MPKIAVFQVRFVGLILAVMVISTSHRKSNNNGNDISCNYI